MLPVEHFSWDVNVMSGIWCFESEQFLVINKRVMNPACERKSYYDYEEDTLRNSIKELKNYKVKKKMLCRNHTIFMLPYYHDTKQ